MRLLISILFCLTGLCGFGAAQSNLVLPTTTIDAGTSTYQAPSSITNSSNSFTVVGTANVTLKAGSSITLLPGFDAKATNGSFIFTAMIASVSSITVTDTQPPAAANPSKEYIYLGGRVVAIENH